MEAVLINSTGNNKHRIGNPNMTYGTNRTLFPYPSDNLLLASFLGGGHFGGGGLLSYPAAASAFRPPHNFQIYGQQPPLLPLPISMPVNHLNMNISRSNSTPNNHSRSSPPRINKNIKNRGRDHSLTPKKSKNQKKDAKKAVVDLPPPATTKEMEAEAPPAEKSVSPSIGPDPKDLAKEVVISRAFSTSINKSCDIESVSDDFDKFSGSAMFTPSPPPSSLPLPTFSLRSKRSCKVEASGVDVGATDSLRRLLRL